MIATYVHVASWVERRVLDDRGSRQTADVLLGILEELNLANWTHNLEKLPGLLQRDLLVEVVLVDDEGA